METLTVCTEGLILLPRGPGCLCYVINGHFI